MRRTTAKTYIDKLLESGCPEAVRTGKKLKLEYEKFKTTLKVEDFTRFLDLILQNSNIIMKALGGLPQLIGQFRAFSLEEYVLELLVKKAGVNRERIFWNEDVIIWKRGSKVCKMKFDIVVGHMMKDTVYPLVTIEAKVDVDAPRLKASIFEALMVKRLYRDCKCLLAYVGWHAGEIWYEIAMAGFDSVYKLYGSEGDVERFIEDARRYSIGTRP